jgi:hypothetical protein
MEVENNQYLYSYKIWAATPHSLLLPQSPSILLSQRAATVQESAGARKHWGQAALKNIMPDLRFI